MLSIHKRWGFWKEKSERSSLGRLLKPRTWLKSKWRLETILEQRKELLLRTKEGFIVFRISDKMNTCQCHLKQKCTVDYNSTWSAIRLNDHLNSILCRHRWVNIKHLARNITVCLKQLIIQPSPIPALDLWKPAIWCQVDNELSYYHPIANLLNNQGSGWITSKKGTNICCLPWTRPPSVNSIKHSNLLVGLAILTQLLGPQIWNFIRTCKGIMCLGGKTCLLLDVHLTNLSLLRRTTQLDQFSNQLSTALCNSLLCSSLQPTTFSDF